MTDQTPQSPKVPEKRARQGRRGMPVLIVLIVALVLAMIAWGGAEMFGWFIEPEQTIGEPDSAPESVEEQGGGD